MRRLLPRGRGRAPGAGAQAGPEGPMGPCGQREEAAAERAAGRLVVGGRAGLRGELGRPAGPAVRPSCLSPLP